jgi:pantoate--beta-alanine ligase
MQIVRTPGSARAVSRTLKRPVGFVPTMGPLQFGPGEDFEKYPRAFAADVERLEALGVDLLYAPAVERIYPPDFAATVSVGALGESFEGARRPGHFTGVATIVAKLLHAIEPTSLYLGQKDVQQTAVLRAMVRDLDMATNVVVVPTVREADGLALSSRNVYLTPQQRSAAPTLHQALAAVAAAIEAGETDPARARAAGEALLGSPLAWDYLAIVDPATFREVAVAGRSCVVLGVAFAGATRLLDNVPVPSLSGVDPVLTPVRRRARSAELSGGR